MIHLVLLFVLNSPGSANTSYNNIIIKSHLTSSSPYFPVSVKTIDNPSLILRRKGYEAAVMHNMSSLVQKKQNGKIKKITWGKEGLQKTMYKIDK